MTKVADIILMKSEGAKTKIWGGHGPLAPLVPPPMWAMYLFTTTTGWVFPICCAEFAEGAIQYMHEGNMVSASS